MLNKPSIIKIPDSTFPINNTTIGCASSAYSGCRGNFSCSAYNGACIDTSYSSGGSGCTMFFSIVINSLKILVT